VVSDGTAPSDGATPADASRDADGALDSAADATGDGEAAAPLDGGPPTLTLGGTFNALTLTMVDGTAYISGPRPSDVDAGVRSELRVFFSDKGSLCANGVMRQGETILSIDALSADPAFAAGTYTQMQQSVPGQVDVAITKLDQSCGATGQDYGAQSGTVVITSLTASNVAGTFDVTLGGGAGTLTGSFSAPICGTAFSGGSCQP
jgi:hypothetical protein